MLTPQFSHGLNINVKSTAFNNVCKNLEMVLFVQNANYSYCINDLNDCLFNIAKTLCKLKSFQLKY